MGCSLYLQYFSHGLPVLDLFSSFWPLLECHLLSLGVRHLLSGGLQALCAPPSAGSWAHLEQTSLPCCSPATLSTFQCLEGDVPPSVKDLPGTHGSPLHPVIPFSSFRVKLGSFPEGCLPGPCTPVWVKSHCWMFPRCHISFLCGAHPTWNFPFYLGDYRTHFCLPLRS